MVSYSIKQWKLTPNAIRSARIYVKEDSLQSMLSSQLWLLLFSLLLLVCCVVSYGCPRLACSYWCAV